MSERKSIFLKKKITSPRIIKELELIEKETNQYFNEIAYNMIVEKINERIREREMCDCIVNDKLTVGSLRYEVNRILDKYPVK